MSTRKQFFMTLVFCVFGMHQVSAGAVVHIEHVRGEVQIRRGVQEKWQPAHAGMRLKEIDTILTGETGQVTLRLQSDRHFVLGPNAILDISELRRITKRELFLYLMSEKVNRLPSPGKHSKPRIGNVSVLHGESKMPASPREAGATPELYRFQLNGARALYGQKYYPNAVIKLTRLSKMFAAVDDCGERLFLLAETYTALGMQGEAIDAYQQTLQAIQARDCAGREAAVRRRAAESALNSLKN